MVKHQLLYSYLVQTSPICGAEKVHQHKNLLIRIGDWERKVAVGFLDRDNLPPLMGRLDCLETFNLSFDKKVSIFSTTPGVE